MSEETPLKQGTGAVWVQPGGPNTALHFLGCYDVDDIESPQGEPGYIYCRQPDRSLKTIGETIAPPEPVTTTLTGLTYRQRDWLEKMGCKGGVYITHSNCGRLDNFGNFQRAYILEEVRKTGWTISNAAHHMEDAQTTQAFAISARPPLRAAVELSADRVSTTEAQAANDIAGNVELRCLGDCGEQIDPGEKLVIAVDSAAGPATANFLYSNNGLTTSPSAAAADPLASVAGRSIMACRRIDYGRATVRWLAAGLATAGAQGYLAYSDDGGASWTSVAIGGAAAGHGATYGGGLMALDERHLWLASAAGYIYFSEDGGASWTAVEAGAIAAGDYTQVHFADENYGMAVGAAGVVAKSTDGGLTWQAATVISGTPALTCVHVIDRNRAWVGTATGRLYYTIDAGVTWTERTFAASGAGQVRDIDFIDEYIGFMVKNSAAPVGTVLRTINGGTTWESMTTPTNSGLNAVLAVDENLAYAVGETNGGTAVLLKISD